MWHCKGLQLKVFANCGREKEPAQENAIFAAVHTRNRYPESIFDLHSKEHRTWLSRCLSLADCDETAKTLYPSHMTSSPNPPKSHHRPQPRSGPLSHDSKPPEPSRTRNDSIMTHTPIPNHFPIQFSDMTPLHLIPRYDSPMTPRRSLIQNP